MKRPSAMNSVGAVSAIVIPMLAVVILGFAWGRELTGGFVAFITLLLAASILAAVHHAETVGVATALLVLLLPAIAAVRAAQHNLIETSLHLLSVRR